MAECESVCLSIVRVPEGLEDVSTYPKLVEELLRRGYSDEEASKVVGKNLITAMVKMEQVSRWPFCNKNYKIIQQIVTMSINTWSGSPCYLSSSHNRYREIYCR